MCEVSKSPGNVNWPDVIIRDTILNLDKGSILKYDPNIRKYVSIEEDEDVGPGDEYYYSGSAIALDPYIVKDLGDLFEVIPVQNVCEECNEKPTLEERVSELERVIDGPEVDIYSLLDRVIALEKRFENGPEQSR